MSTTAAVIQEVFDVDEEKSGKEFTTAMTSDAGGAYSEAVVMKGWLVRVKTDPGATAPTDNWDLELKDASGFDVLGGLLLNRDTANTEVVPLPGTGINVICYLNGTYTITGSNMGNTKDATVGWTLKNR